HPNGAGAFLATALIACILAARRVSSLHGRMAGFSSALLIFAAIVLTGSRGAFIVALVPGLFLWWVSLQQSRAVWTLLAVSTFLAILLLANSTDAPPLDTPSGSAWTGLPRVLTRVASIVQLGRLQTSGARVETWKAGID